MSTKKDSLFAVINEAKNHESLPLANLAFAVLIDITLKGEEGLHFSYQREGGTEDDDWYDLLVVRDDKSADCIPVRMLRNPEIYHPLCREGDEPCSTHPLRLYCGLMSKEKYEFLLHLILQACPDAPNLARKYLDYETGLLASDAPNRYLWVD